MKSFVVHHSALTLRFSSAKMQFKYLFEELGNIFKVQHLKYIGLLLQKN